MSDTIGKGISYNPFKTEDKHYYGSFLNLAENNLEAVIIEFKERTNDKNLEKHIPEIIQKHFYNNMSIVDYENKISILKEYLPVIDFLDNELEQNLNDRIAYFKDTFLVLIKTLSELRNFYTHFYHNELEFGDNEAILIKFLDQTLFNIILDVKKNYLKADKTKEILKDSLNDELTRLTYKKLEELREKKKNNPKFKFSDKPDQIKNSLFNDAFRDLLYENKKEKQNTTLSNKAKVAFNKNINHIKSEIDFQTPLSTSVIHPIIKTIS